MIISSEKNNKYYLSHQLPQVILMHPILAHLVNLHESGENVGQWVENYKDGELSIDGQTTTASHADVRCYYNYFQFLKENKYFDTRKTIPMRETYQYTSREVEFRVANTEQIVLEVTDGCNLNCRYCGYGDFYSGHDERTGKKMDFKTAKTVIDKIIGLKKKHLSYIKTHRKFAISFYGGEPLMNFPLIKKTVDYVKTIHLPNIEFLFSVTTNGVLLNRYREFLVENNFLVIVSLDGNKENNKHRVFHNGRNSFTKVFSNIDEIKRKHPAYFKENVMFNSVIHKNNSTPEIQDFFKENFDKKPITLGLATSTIRKDKKKEFDKVFERNEAQSAPEYNEDDEKKFFSGLKHSNIQKFSQLDQLFKIYSGYTFTRINTLLEDQTANTADYTSTGTCQPYEKKVFVTVNGKLMPCERISQQYFMGTVTDDDFQLDFQGVADRYNNYYKNLSRLCDHCYNKKMCGQCIFYLNLEDKNVKCPNFLSKKEFGKKLSFAVSILEEVPAYYNKIIENLSNTGEE